MPLLKWNAHGFSSVRDTSTSYQRLCIGISRPKMLQHNQRIRTAQVFDEHSCFSSRSRDKELVLGHVAEADHRRSAYRLLCDPPMALGQNRPIGCFVTDLHPASREYRELLGGVMRRAIGDPQLAITLIFHLRMRFDRPRFRLVCLSDLRV